MHARTKAVKRALSSSFRCIRCRLSRTRLSRKPVLGCLAVVLLLAVCLPTVHADLGSEEQFVLNSFSFLIWGRW